MLNRVRLALTAMALVVTLLAGCLHMQWTKHTAKRVSLVPKRQVVPRRQPLYRQLYNHYWAQRIHHLRWKLWEAKQDYRGRHRRLERERAALTSPANLGVTMSEQQFRACVISRESGGNPRALNPASDAGGLYQFLPSTWASLGFAKAYPGGAQTAPVSVQNAAFYKAYAESGTSPWAPYDGC